MRFMLPLGLIFFLTACISTANYYTSTLNSWRGANANALTQKWGSPDTKIINPNGSMVYIYKTKSYEQGPTPIIPVGVNVSPTGRPVIISPVNSVPRAQTLSCLAVFDIDTTGRITASEVRGKGCYGSSNFANKLSNKPD